MGCAKAISTICQRVVFGSFRYISHHPLSSFSELSKEVIVFLLWQLLIHLFNVSDASSLCEFLNSFIEKKTWEKSQSLLLIQHIFFFNISVFSFTLPDLSVIISFPFHSWTASAVTKDNFVDFPLACLSMKSTEFYPEGFAVSRALRVRGRSSHLRRCGTGALTLQTPGSLAFHVWILPVPLQKGPSTVEYSMTIQHRRVRRGRVGLRPKLFC